MVMVTNTYIISNASANARAGKFEQYIFSTYFYFL